jgi:thiol-disulfide isomerase/thioredoxin
MNENDMNITRRCNSRLLWNFDRRVLLTDEDADARITSGFVIAGFLTFIMLAVVLFTDIPPIGPTEGLLAPNLTGDTHSLGSSGWQSFQLYDELDYDWEADSNSSSKWFFIQFMDTDCPYCWDDADMMSQVGNQFADKVTVISVAVSLDIPGHSSSTDEIIAFQEKTSHSGCKGGGTDCSTRPGEAHNWLYLNDLFLSESDKWEIEGTPFVVIVRPDGIVAWNQGQHPQPADPGQALADLVLEPEV